MIDAVGYRESVVGCSAHWRNIMPKLRGVSRFMWRDIMST